MTNQHLERRGGHKPSTLTMRLDEGKWLDKAQS